MVVANGPFLYVGFDNAVDGVVIYRSQMANPLVRGDFLGAAGCVAGAGCAGVGGNGLGGGHKRIFDGSSFGSGVGTFLYVTAGDGSAPLRVFRSRD